jgi:Kdo2-lipid IVA lauroyltransferase/acyltransferase
MFNSFIHSMRKEKKTLQNRNEKIVYDDVGKSGKAEYSKKLIKEKKTDKYKMSGIWYELAYRTLYLFVFLISLLPMKILYAFSSFAYMLVYHLFSYRKTIVIQNLSRSFPDKNYSEIEYYVKEFYRSFTDHFMEIIKTISISKEKQSEKVNVINPEIISNLISQDKNVFAFIGHCGNWEMLNVFPYILHFDTYAVYRPLSSKVIDKFMYTLRSRFGMKLISEKSVVKHILSNQNSKSVYLFLADQCPKTVAEDYRFEFLNQQTSMFSGAEKLARKTGAASVYVSLIQVSRGNYQFDFIPICSDPEECQETDITKRYVQLLEDNIRKKPSGWLWSHKRWKR